MSPSTGDHRYGAEVTGLNWAQAAYPAAIAEFLERSRVSPGELGDLYAPTVGGRYRSGPQRLTSSDPGP